MSVFDDNILDKVPEEAIWDWFKNFKKDLPNPENYFVIKDNIIYKKDAWSSCRFDIKEPIPSYIKFDESPSTQRSLLFFTSKFKKEYKDLPFYRIEEPLHNDYVKSYDIMVLKSPAVNSTIEFLGLCDWKLNIRNFEDLNELTIKYHGENDGRIYIDQKVKECDIKYYKEIVEKFYRKTPSLLVVAAYISESLDDISFRIQDGRVNICKIINYYISIKRLGINGFYDKNKGMFLILYNNNVKELLFGDWGHITILKDSIEVNR